VSKKKKRRKTTQTAKVRNDCVGVVFHQLVPRGQAASFLAGGKNTRAENQQ
jgi:hypothetical protein